MQLRCNTAERSKKAFLITEGFTEEVGCIKGNRILYCILQTAQIVRKEGRRLEGNSLTGRALNLRGK